MEYEIQVLSLQKNKDRRQHTKEVMDSLGLNYTFFNAVKPREVTKDMEESLFSKVDYYDWDIDQKAVMATFVSHLALLHLSYSTKCNMLVLEDDIELSDYDFDLTNIDFTSFDVFNLGTQISCYAYFLSWQGAGKVLDILLNKEIIKAYDWELCELGLQNKIKYKTTSKPVWKQVDTFKSNIAPNGYKLKNK